MLVNFVYLRILSAKNKKYRDRQHFKTLIIKSQACFILMEDDGFILQVFLKLNLLVMQFWFLLFCTSCSQLADTSVWKADSLNLAFLSKGMKLCLNSVLGKTQWLST